MGGKSKPPPAPDYTALTKQQGELNKDAGQDAWRLNNSSTSTPWGNRRLVADPNEPSGYRIEETLDPQDLGNLNASRGIQSQLLGMAPGMLDTLKNTLSAGFDTKGLPGMVAGVDTSGLEKLNFNIPKGQYGFDRGQIQGNVDFSGLDKVQSGEDVRNRVEQAGMDKFMRRAQPQFDRQADALNTRLANMGGNTSSRAGRQQVEDLRRAQNDAMTDAQFDSVLRGGEEAQRQFGMSMQGRQQGVAETMNQAQFRNQAQQQDFSQLGQLADLWNSTRGQDAGLQAQQVGMNNQTQQQNISNAFQNAGLQNSVRSAGLNERAQLRQMPLNEIMAVLSGTQVNQPNFTGPNQTSGWAPPNVYQAGQDQYNANVANNNANNARRAAPWNALAGLAGSWLSSDRRLKSNIVRIGSTDGGLPLYRYVIHGRTQIGVMADEVPADARKLDADGYWMVDYSKVR
jgi:hypothetical protein